MLLYHLTGSICLATEDITPTNIDLREGAGEHLTDYSRKCANYCFNSRLWMERENRDYDLFLRPQYGANEN